MREVEAEGECTCGVAPFLLSGLYVSPCTVHPRAEVSEDESGVSGAWPIVGFLVGLVVIAGLLATYYVD